MKRSLPLPTPAELAILDVLWQRQGSSVREIHNALVAATGEETGYSTTLKLLQVMTGKRLVIRDDSARPQRYTSALTREETEHQLLADLQQRAFGGSARRLVLRALGAEEISERDLQKIEKLLSRAEER